MKKYHVFGIGNSLLDLTFQVSDRLVEEMGLVKGGMVLVDSETNKKILETLKEFSCKIFPGGSSANTLSGVSILGGNAGFLGKLGEDENGNIYEKKTREYRVSGFFSRDCSLATGNTITLISPDGERTFAVYLGASVRLDERDVMEEMIANSNILHLEAYTLESDETRKAVLRAIELARKNGVKVSLDLSDSGLVQRNLDFLKKFIRESVDILFLNEPESIAFTGKNSIAALDEISEICGFVALKLGEKGSLIKTNGRVYEIPAFKTKVVNTNGSGDMYAAGLLYCIAEGIDLEKAGRLASFAASLVVSSEGARLEKDLISVLNDYKLREIGK